MVANTVVAIWTRPEPKRKFTQYALWSNGDLNARVASGPLRIGAWEERKRIKFPNDFKKINKQLIDLGFELEYRSGQHGIGGFVGKLFKEDPKHAANPSK